ncbi:hypothetical protein DOY81_009604, partial [Sarcophaga bullata]
MSRCDHRSAETEAETEMHASSQQKEISGLSLIWIGIWMQTDFLNYLQINTAYSDQAPYVLLIMGAIIVFVSSLACSCIVKVQSSMLVVYGGFLITMLFSLISLSVYVYAYKDELLAGVSSGISNQIQKYDDQHPTNSANSLMDFIQKNIVLPHIVFNYYRFESRRSSERNEIINLSQKKKIAQSVYLCLFTTTRSYYLP